jgi:xanthine dehydrogenase accessory factor
VESLVGPLLPLFERERAAHRALALAVVIHTAGSTYRKPGALMLIAHDGSYAGLLSGGCLETDLREHARAVIETGKPHTVTYDMGGTDDALWGLGVGCEGAMRIFLLRVGPENNWQPIDHLARALEKHAPAAAAIVIDSSAPAYRAGDVVVPGSTPELNALFAQVEQSGKAAWLDSADASLRVFAISLALPPRVLVLGAGPDAMPVVDLAMRMGWKAAVYDHRPAYAQSMHFPGAERVLLGHSDELARALDLAAYDAAIVMSHHLTSDLHYLKALAASPTPYVGLLGPAIRREKLLSDLGDEAVRLRTRLHAPVGLALGGRSPESIALAIVAEIHAYLHGREGGPFSAAVASAGYPQTEPGGERQTV